jgi:hypothetical protein
VEDDIEELTPQESQNFVDAVSDILEILHETGSTENSLQIVSAVTSYILCHWMVTSDDAQTELNKFIDVVVTTINVAASSGNATWTNGPAN